ncbi:prostatic acid phosphatase-like isoform X2 [Phymastichus coffea]|uniref:prostatic acid phosphatase-like isoform X2 n=1 Tax=Phymastichus coffea TaxID=108790 RepID=UPI00273CD56E|nr:prostatic acid phosphatase-like isoform X2 [Phymastichus coffea]
MEVNKELNDQDLKLELVQVIFRHGARTPVREELDVYKFNDVPAYEPWGVGQLTNDGKRQEYHFGSFLRERYGNFLSEYYQSDDVYAYSTDVHRTKMSLQLVLAGLYPPVGHAVWNPDLKWSPIPYVHAPAVLDIFMKYHDNPRFQKLRYQACRTEEFRKKIAEYDDFLAFLSEQTNVNFDDDFLNVAFLYGVIVADERMNLPLPDWYKPEMKEKFRQLMGFVFDGFAFTLEMKKLGAGPLIKTIIENMNLKGSNINPRKIYLYSGHDFNIALITRSHNIEDYRYPEFGCGLIFEKLRDCSNQVYLLAWTGSGTLIPLKLGNHKEFCPIDDYLKLVEPIIPSDNEIDEMLEDVSIRKFRNIFFNDHVVKPLHNKL